MSAPLPRAPPPDRWPAGRRGEFGAESSIFSPSGPPCCAAAAAGWRAREACASLDRWRRAARLAAQVRSGGRHAGGFRNAVTKPEAAPRQLRRRRRRLCCCCAQHDSDYAPDRLYYYMPTQAARVRDAAPDRVGAAMPIFHLSNRVSTRAFSAAAAAVAANAQLCRR